MFLKFCAGKLGEGFFALRRFFFLGATAACSSVEIGSSSVAPFFLRLFFGTAGPAAPFFFFQDALALFSDSLKLVRPAA